MSHSIAFHLVAICAGAAFGALYLALLWHAVRVLTRRGNALSFAVTGLVRGGLLIAALAGGLALGATASHIAAALLGFVALRITASRVATTAQTGAKTWK